MTIQNLYIHYDEDGTAHHYINDDEVPKDEWLQQHPHFRKGNSNERAGSDSGNISGQQVGADQPAEVNEQIRQGIRDARERDKAARGGGNSGAAGDGVGQPED